MESMKTILEPTRVIYYFLKLCVKALPFKVRIAMALKICMAEKWNNSSKQNDDKYEHYLVRFIPNARKWWKDNRNI